MLGEICSSPLSNENQTEGTKIRHTIYRLGWWVDLSVILILYQEASPVDKLQRG